MITRVSLTGLCFAVALAAATDPFVGSWKLNSAKSQLAGEELTITLRNNEITFDDGNVADTVPMDGADHDVHYGRTMAVSTPTAYSLQQVYKDNGRVLETVTWTISNYGKTLTVADTRKRADGSDLTVGETLQREGKGAGFAGKWISAKVDVTAPFNLTVTANGDDGLTFTYPEDNDTISLKFDGQDYPETGPNVVKDSTSSAHRAGPDKLEVTDKVAGKPIDTATYEVSADGATLTMRFENKGQKSPQVLVYDRQ